MTKGLLSQEALSWYLSSKQTRPPIARPTFFEQGWRQSNFPRIYKLNPPGFLLIFALHDSLRSESKTPLPQSLLTQSNCVVASRCNSTSTTHYLCWVKSFMSSPGPQTTIALNRKRVAAASRNYFHLIDNESPLYSLVAVTMVA